MTDDADTVLELKLDAALTGHLPLDAGDDPVGAIEAALAECEAIRHVDDIDVEQIYKIKEY